MEIWASIFSLASGKDIRLVMKVGCVSKSWKKFSDCSLWKNFRHKVFFNPLSDKLLCKQVFQDNISSFRCLPTTKDESIGKLPFLSALDITANDRVKATTLLTLTNITALSTE